MLNALKKSALFFSSLLILGVGISGAWAGTATIDATVTDQYIHGFGAASAWNSAGNLSPWAQTLWANDNVNGHVGLSLLRTRIDPTDTGSGTAWNSEAAPMTLAKSVNSNIIIWSTEWSPPAAYKGNNNVDGGGSNGTLNSSATFTGAASGSPNAADAGYAGYLTRYLQYIKSKFGVDLYAISPQNEPDWDPTYEAAIWNAGQFDVFVPCLAASITSAGLDTKIMITESFGDRLALASTTMNDPVAAPLVSIIAGHIYGGGPNPLSAGGFSHLTTQENWETEISDVSGAGFDTSMTSGLMEASWVHNCMTTGDMDAFHHWWIYGTDNSALISSGGTSKKLMVLGNYSKFVRPGYYRMGATTVPSSGVSVTAYKNTNNSSPTTIVIVAINGNSSTTSQTFSLNGLDVTSVTPWVTNSSNDLVQQAAVPVSGNSFTYNLTGPSVTSFVGVNNGGTPVPTSTPTLTPTPVVQSTWRVNSGGPTYTDTKGNVWVADENYTGGTTIASGGTITGTSDSTLYDTQRYGTSFSYSFNVPAGSYQVTLKLAETYSGDDSTGSRVFDVAINGTTVTSNLDVYSQVGANTADDQVYNSVSPSGGVITIVLTEMTATDANAALEAIQIIPMPATPTPTATASKTLTATATRTSTTTPTPTASLTPTFTATVTATPTATRTATLTSTPTSTASLTPTQTSSPTPTSSVTATATGTPTSTSSPTITSTPVPGATNTFTFTVTVTSTASPTATTTETPTDSSTPSFSPTASASPTWTLTPPPGATNTFTPTKTATPTSTSTSTATDTRTFTPTATPSRTASPMPTQTPTLTKTSTWTLTFTPTKTFTWTPTTTFTWTPTPTASWTATPTPQATVSLSLSVSPSSVAPGAPMTYVLRLTVSNGNSNNTTLTLNLPSDVSFDGYTTGTSGTNSGNQVTWNLGTLAPGSYDYGVEVTVSTTATGSLPSQGSFSEDGGTGTSNTAVVTVNPWTATPTATSLPVAQPVIYPNPANGEHPVEIRLPAYAGTANITLKVFTTAFRMVNSLSYASQTGGSDVVLPLTDRNRVPLADGLYYVLVQTPDGKSIEKLLILR